MHILKTLVALCATLALAAPLGACGGGGTPSASTKPNFAIHVTDAPFPGDLVEAASVVIRQVQIREFREEGDEEAPWHTAFDGRAEIDLVPLTGGVSELLVAVDLPPGVYDEVRLLVEAGEVVLKQEAVVAGGSHVFNTDFGNLRYPSGAQTGIKVKLDDVITVVTELTSDLTLDFDIARNFVFNGPMTHAPGVRNVLFTPVVRAVNSSTAGRVDVQVLSDNATPGDDADDVPLAGATVRALDDTGADAGSGLTDAQGEFSLQLAPGTYTIVLEAMHHEGMTSGDVEVVLANLTDLGVVTLAATGGEVHGTVFSDRGTPADDTDDVVLEGATVTATAEGAATPEASTTTDNQGAFRFLDLPPGTYTIDVGAPGFSDGSVGGIVPTVGGTAVTPTLAAFARNVTGTVVDGAGMAAAGVDVTSTDAAGQAGPTTTTAADGTYALELPTGTWTLHFADAATGETATEVVTVVGTDPTSDQTQDVTLTAAP